MSDEYRVTSNHAENLADGRMVGPGEKVAVDAKDPHNKQLIDAGRLTPVPKSESKSKTASNKEGDES